MRWLNVSVILVGTLVLGLTGFTIAAKGATACPNEEFRVGSSANLPDCRAYELVTPPYKAGEEFEPWALGPGLEGTPDLVSVSYAAINGLENDDNFPGGYYSTTRTQLGWVTTPITPTAREYELGKTGFGEPDEGESLDARSAVWSAWRFTSQPEGEVHLYVTRPGHVIEDVGIVTPPGTPPEADPSITTDLMHLHVVGESNDLSHILFSLNHRHFKEEQLFHFWPFDETLEEGRAIEFPPNFKSERGTFTLYEFIGKNNVEPMLVGVNNEGRLISRCTTQLGGINEAGRDAGPNAVSRDGGVVFFTAIRCGSSPPVNELFARIDNGLPDAHTIAISEPVPADCAECDTTAPALQPALFDGASEDGSKVFFTTAQPLLDSDGNLNIYEYDFNAPTGKRIIHVSAGDGTVSNPAAQVQGVVATAQDGSHIYFVAKGVLTDTSNAQGQTASPGANNLYMFERDPLYPAGRIVFMASLAATDNMLWQPEGPGGRVPVSARLTPDGRFLVFTSVTAHLTPDDTSAAQQAFEYDADTGDLVRVSIGQNGYNANGNTDVAAAELGGAFHPIGSADAYAGSLTMSSNGAYVFFQSTDGLTPQAINNPGGQAKNIYEYHEGQIYLISDGRDVSNHVKLVGVSASGADVLFTTLDQLAPQDTDSLPDIYDARVGGGFPPPAPPAECSGDACQGPLAAAPVLLSPGSEFQAGGENVTIRANAPSTKTKVKAKPKKRKKRKKVPRKGRASERSHSPGGNAHGGKRRA
jgi:hypothetical protein